MARDNRIDRYSDKAKEVLDTKVSQELLRKREQAEEVMATQISDAWTEKQSKPKMMDTHMRTSFLFRKDLRARLDVLSDYHGRGYRTQFLNQAIQFALDSAEAELENQ